MYQYKHTIAVFTATSAALMTLAAGPASAEEVVPAPVACIDNNVIRINVSPPPPLAGRVEATDIQTLVESIVAGASPEWLLSVFPNSAPSASPSPAPSFNPSPPPSGVPSPTPSSAASGLTPAAALIDALVGRAVACVNGIPVPASAVPYAPLVDAPGVEQLLESLLSTPAVCTTLTGPTPTGPTPTPTPASLLDVIGVGRVLTALTTRSAACAGPASAPASAATTSSSVSLLDAIGVTGLVNGLIGG